MMSYDFETTTHGKWILTGEHAVLRGNAALVFPIRERSLRLKYSHSDTKLSAEYQGKSGPDLHLLFWSVLEEGLQQLGRSLNHLTGHFYLHSDIPIGVGLGASAALCVAMSRWFAAQRWFKEDEIFSFAKKLENLFHGQSSGLDIAGVAAEGGILFKEGTIEPLCQAWKPHLILSSCNQIGLTSHCINQVQHLWQTNPEKAASLDELMQNSTLQAKAALEHDGPASLMQLKKAIQQAADCFIQWGLVSDSLQQHLQMLINAGALAAKPTGSGGGGYVLSLWDKKPPAMAVELIEV